MRVECLVLYNQQQGLFYMHHPTDRIVHSTHPLLHSRGARAGTRNILIAPP